MLQMQFKDLKQQLYILDNAHVVYLRTHGDYGHLVGTTHHSNTINIHMTKKMSYNKAPL